MLKSPKGITSTIENPAVFYIVICNGVFNKIAYSPVFAFYHSIIPAILVIKKGDNITVIFSYLWLGMECYLLDVVHDLNRLFKYIVIDSLKDILLFFCAVFTQQHTICIVNMTVYTLCECFQRSGKIIMAADFFQCMDCFNIHT